MKKTGKPFLICAASLLSLMTLHAEDLPAVFQRVKNSVVVIEAQQKSAGISSSTVENILVRGTGVLINERREVMTASDIVQTANWIQAGVGNNKMVSARVESSATQADVAILELENVPPGIAGAKFGDSDKITSGQSVFIVSVSSDDDPRMTACHIIRRLQRETDTKNFPEGDLLEIDSGLAQQDDGAPLFNTSGEVIGIVSTDPLSVPHVTDRSFAVPTNIAVKLTIKTPFVWTGISGRLLIGPAAQQFNLPQDKGYLIEKISDTSPSAKLGLQSGDIVLAVDGISFCADDAVVQIREHLRKLVTGGAVRVNIFRNGKIEELSSTFEP